MQKLLSGIFSILLLFLFTPIASQNIRDSLERSIGTVEGQEQVVLMIELGNMLIYQDQEKALELGLNAAQVAKRQGDLLQEGNAALLMGRASLAAQQNENSIRYFNRALNHFEKVDHSVSQIYALKGIADVYRQERDFRLARNFLVNALSIANTIENISLQLELHYDLGEIAIQLDNLSEANDEFTSILRIIDTNGGAQEKSYQHLKAKAYRQIGYIFRGVGKYQESLNAYRSAQDIAVRLNDSSNLYIDKQNIAYAFYLMNEYDSSLVYYNRVLTSYRMARDSVSMVSALIGMGDVYFGQQFFRKAVDTYNRSYDMALKLNLEDQQVASLVNISRCFNAFGDFPSSQDYLIRALSIARKGGLSSSAADVYMYLSELNEREGRIAQALDYYKLWAELRDSIYSEESGQKLARMQILYEISQKERENEILRQNNEISSLTLVKTRYQRMGFIILAFFLFVVVVLLTFFYQSKRQQLQKQKETEQRIVELNKNLERRLISEVKKQEKQQLLLAQKSKLESLGTLTAGIAHEVNQPLGGISMGVENIYMRVWQKDLTEEYLKEKILFIIDNVERIKRIIEQIRKFSRAQKSVTLERVDVNETVKSALLMMETQFSSHQVGLKLNLVSEMEPVVADKTKLEQVILNLLSNAKYAVEEKALHVEEPESYEKMVEVTTYEDDEAAYIVVLDNGSGIKQKDLEKVFDPFFTTKKQDQGTGLGLSVSYGYIKDILGDINVESSEGLFTKFEVRIPK